MTTYLRVKRPRHVAPPSSMRVEGLGEESHKRSRVDNLAELLHQSTYINQQQQQQQQQQATLSRSNTIEASNTSAVWKRVELTATKRSFKYVNALLEEEEVGEPHTKRRRLALTLLHDTPTKTTIEAPAKKKKNIILDPRSRLVQESLQSVFSGDTTVTQHVDFITQDARVCDTPRVWLAWEDVRSGAGNVLHAAALRNDVEGASSLLHWNVPSLVTALNSDGQTPHQVAVAVGHTQVAQVLQFASNAATQQQDDDDYVYDVFLLDKEMKDTHNDSDNNNNNNNNEEEPTSVELRGGVGYWNENGDLILEAMQDDSSEDDDEDSNCEEHVANDYPEEEEFWDSEGEEEELSFRHRPIHWSDGDGTARVKSGPTLVDEDEEYDAQYDLYEPSGPPREYAYDPELDSESDE